jgi:hypothetical protein
MLGKSVWAIIAVLLCTASVGGCGKKAETRQSGDDDQVFVNSKEIIVAHGRAGGAKEPPCIRRGMEDVLPAAKGFATEHKSVSYASVGKDTPVTALVLDDPRTTRGVSMVVRNVEDELKNVGPEDAKALEHQPYSSCGTVAFLLPQNSTQVRTVVSAGVDGETLQPCDVAEGDYTKCRFEQAAWISFHENRYLVVTFKNWSDNVDRAVKIEVVP